MQPLPTPRSVTPPAERVRDDARCAADLELARRVVAGDQVAWESFVSRYAGLIHAVARRYLLSRDPDEVRDVFVAVLASLRRIKLSRYEGRASLATWLTLVTRTEVMDHLRRTFGRDAGGGRVLARLAPEQRRLFRLYYIEGRTAADVIAALDTPASRWTPERLLAALRHLEQTLGDRWLRRLSYDLYAQSVGATSGRLLEYLDHVRDEYERQAGAFSPDYHVLEREARRTAERLREAIAALPPPERALLQMRFERGWSAAEIAGELGFARSRGVYTMLERIVRGLRRRLTGAEPT